MISNRFRERINLTLPRPIIILLRRLSDESGAPISRLIEKAVLEKYGEKMEKEEKEKC